ncbi:MAG TPA: glycine--tRNA ligase subunit beta [Thermohalobaculum sp.]|nr:glycine--tRNA ligase subunit beta [Thermohalobaculum sp.]
MPDLLLELFSEEIPARMQARAAEDLAKLVTSKLVEAGLTYAEAGAFATPRRLTLHLTGLPKMTTAMREERKGPRTDAPDQALQGFLRATGLTKDQLEARNDKKGQLWYAVIEKPGRPAAEVIAEAVTDTVRNFPWPKSMRWGAGSLRWVRPLHSILCLLYDETGPEVVPFEIDGIVSGDSTEGHRFMAPGRFRVNGFDDYALRLAAAKVVLDPAERAARIEHDATQLAFAQGLEVVADKALLAEVAGLVEWPVTLMGQIGEAFLDLPPEVLQTSMKAHQKFFSVRNPKTGRIERFITVANIETPDHGKTILEGNGRVLAARLTDARFFWDNDLRRVKDHGADGMAEMAKPLENVVFHAKLGTQAERIERIGKVAFMVTGFARMTFEDARLALIAASIAKADLASEMVYEFPELQGVMGGYYARAAGLPEEVANACEAHHRPLGPSDAVPAEPVSVAVALADKIDMLTAFWWIDERPTGSKDPYALRRAALGILRTILENGIRIKLLTPISVSMTLNAVYATAWTERDADLNTLVIADAVLSVLKSHGQDQFSNVDLDDVFKAAQTAKAIDFAPKIEPRVQDLLSFFADRLKVYLRDQGIRHDVIQACFDLGGQDDLVLLVNRVRALQTFLGTEDGANLLTGYRRAANMVAAEEKKDAVEYSGAPDIKFTELDQERALFTALDTAEPAIKTALEAEDFAAAMGSMAKLRPVIDSFFDKVTVNADNQIVRRNRLCLLTRIRSVMRQVAVWDAIEG